MQEKTIYFRWSFRNFVPFLSRKGRALWAFALVERVAAGALKVPVPPADALKTHSPPNFFYQNNRNTLPANGSWAKGAAVIIWTFFLYVNNLCSGADRSFHHSGL